jgi:DNA-binding Lrp family transcriptional regulator
MPLVGEGDTPGDISKLAVPEAARALGISPEAVRNRLSRGTLKSVKEGGTVYVLLETDRLRYTGDTPTDRPGDIRAELVEELRDRISYLERVLGEEREARTEERRRHDTLMAQLMQRIPEIEGPREARESPVSPGPSETPANAGGGREEATERRWWEFWR